MRLWTLHPKYLDAQGLVALWREALLARAVLRGSTLGYRSHPQLTRFRASSRPVQALNAYLAAIYAEAVVRGYHFDRSKLGRRGAVPSLSATRDQLLYEWGHLRRKLRKRNPHWLNSLSIVHSPRAHPLFRVTRGPVAVWERLPGE
jgi:Pyrimidine dimer DNA glycosylase